MSMYKARELVKGLRGSFNNLYSRFYAKSLKEDNHHGIPDEKEFNKQYIEIFNSPDLDGWEIRQAMNDLAGMDLVPDPSITDAALRACRRVNDIALAIRWLETCKHKCGPEVKVIYPYIMKQIKPTLTELGIPTLEELGYDKPQLALVSVFDM